MPDWRGNRRDNLNTMVRWLVADYTTLCTSLLARHLILIDLADLLGCKVLPKKIHLVSSTPS
jgi:hypothetical protein